MEEKKELQLEEKKWLTIWRSSLKNIPDKIKVTPVSHGTAEREIVSNLQFYSPDNADFCLENNIGEPRTTRLFIERFYCLVFTPLSTAATASSFLAKSEAAVNWATSFDERAIRKLVLFGSNHYNDEHNNKKLLLSYTTGASMRMPTTALRTPNSEME